MLLLDKQYERLFMQRLSRGDRSISGLWLDGPGGTIGLLPQNKVGYDSSELSLSSGSSTLVDNLNHIRYRLDNLEIGTAGGIQLYTEDPASPSYGDMWGVVRSNSVKGRLMGMLGLTQSIARDAEVDLKIRVTSKTVSVTLT